MKIQGLLQAPDTSQLGLGSADTQHLLAYVEGAFAIKNPHALIYI